MIFEFNPQIYPTRIWVVRGKDTTLEEIDKRFYSISEDDELLDFNNNECLPPPTTNAQTFVVGDKESYFRGCLIYLNKTKLRSGVLAHEASHCVDWLFEKLQVESGTTFNNGEARAYYLEWITDRIEDVLKNKVK